MLTLSSSFIVVLLFLSLLNPSKWSAEHGLVNVVCDCCYYNCLKQPIDTVFVRERIADLIIECGDLQVNVSSKLKQDTQKIGFFATGRVHKN